MAPHQPRDFLLLRRDASDEDRGPPFQAFLIVMTIISFLSLVFRFWSRALTTSEDQLRRRFWWDDWLALLGLPFLLASYGLVFAMVRFGLGHHLTSVDPANIIPFSTVLFAVYFTYATTLVLLKASALFFYARVFQTRQYTTWFTWALYATHFLNMAWFIGLTFGQSFMCSPPAKAWNPTLPGHCGSTAALWLGSAVPSVVIDFIILILPLPMIWSLKMSMNRKAAITAVFICGYCIIVVSIGRLVLVVKEEAQLEADITWGGVPVLYWLCSEVATLMLCICLPATLNLGRRAVNKYLAPLASQVSSLFSSSASIGGSGVFSRSRDAKSPGTVRMHNVGTKSARDDTSGFQSLKDDKSIGSMESSRRILQPYDPIARVAAIDETGKKYTASGDNVKSMA